MSRTQVFCGTFVHSTDQDYMQILSKHALGVSNGKIVFMEKENDFQKKDTKNFQIHKMKDSELMMPGLIDTHIHAPQYPNAGKGLDKGLLEWLEVYTFPTESKFKESSFASEVYDKVVRRTLENGTTTACYYGTIHLEACKILCDVVDKYGQRAFIGKVNMDQNSPDFYIESTEKSISDTQQFVDEILKRKNPRVKPIITPRFAISCSEDLMKSLGDIAKEKDVHIQTHISETRDEITGVMSMFPDCKDYLDIYDQAGLVTNKTVFGHGIYLTDRERAVIKEKGASISHCPNSNLSIRSGLLDVQKILSDGIKIGLGTDVSGGYSPSILDAMRTAVYVSNMLAIQDPKYKPISHREAFMLATLGGSKALGMESLVGNFEIGKEFDALWVDLASPGSQIDIFSDDRSTEDLIQKFIFLGDNRNIKDVIVGGKSVLQES